MKPTRGVRDELQDGIQHAKAGAQNGDEDDFALELQTVRPGERRLYVNLFDGEGAGGLIDHQRGDFTEQAAEFLRLGLLVAQPGEVVLDQRVGDDRDAFHLIFGGLPEEIHAAGAQFRDVQAEVELHVMSRAALAEHGEKIRDVIPFTIFDHVGITGDVRDCFRAGHRFVEVTELVNKTKFQSL